MNILKHLIYNNFVLFLAPPAWGKTSLVIEMYQETSKSIVFVSPLRALAMEVYARMEKLGNVHYASNIPNKFNIDEKFCLIGTVESICSGLIESLDSKKVIIVFDEFHLFYLWGETFRPILKEFQYLIGSMGFATMGMSASFAKSEVLSWYDEYSLNETNLYIWNEGNLSFKNNPHRKHYFPLRGRFIIQSLFRQEVLKENYQTILLFCRYKREVDEWWDFCQRQKVSAVVCVGGKVPEFLEQLKKVPRPRCIISTTVLSHGVNLPTISKVFINYKVKDFSFWLQMCSRAGRQGERFEIYTIDSFKESPIRLFKSYLINITYLVRCFLMENFGVW